MHLRVQTRLYDKPNDGGGAQAPAPAETPAAPIVAPVNPPAATPPAEVVAVPPAGGTAAPEAPKSKDWKDDRIAKLTHDVNEARREAERLKSAAPAPASAPNPGETEAAFQARVQAEAQVLAAQMAAAASWDKQCNEVFETGTKEFSDFGARVEAIRNTVNLQDAGEVAAFNSVIESAIDTGAAHKVLYALGADPGEYQRLAKLSPTKRAMEIGSMAVKLVADKEPSNLPKPITPINGGSGLHYDGIAPDDPKKGTKLPIKQWMAEREKQARERGIQ